MYSELSNNSTKGCLISNTYPIFLFDKQAKEEKRLSIFHKIVQDRPRSPFLQSTASSVSFDVLCDYLISSLDKYFQFNSTWMDVPFIQQNVVRFTVKFTSTSYRHKAITYTSVIAGYIDRPGPGLELQTRKRRYNFNFLGILCPLLSHH